ncbi:unnamed protein product, partial [Polarella glacialis]
MQRAILEIEPKMCRTQAFESDTSYLKGLIAASFGDNFFIDEQRQTRSILFVAKDRNMQRLEDRLPPRQLRPQPLTVVFLDSAGNVPEACQLVLLDGFEREADRWQPLKSRKAAPQLVSPLRLPAEFNLLFQYEKAMRDLLRSRANNGWTYGAVSIHHPHILHWEWMQPSFSAKKTPMRVESGFDRKNGVG